MTTEEIKRTPENKDLHNILLAAALIMGFIFLVSLSIYLIKDSYGISCGCGVSLPLVIATLTSLGVFVGILTYYLLATSFSKEKERLFGNVEKTLDFLGREEKAILSSIIENNGEIAQNTLRNRTAIDAVTLHRRLLILESKGIVRKAKNGMTNTILLNDDFKALFIK